MKVIAITGHAGSGKDTAACLIQMMTAHYSMHAPIDAEQYVKGCERMSLNALNTMTSHVEKFRILKFAYPVYQIAAILTSHKTADEIMTGDFKKQLWYIGSAQYTGREILQKVGQSARDTFDSHTWIRIMSRELAQARTGAIISDLRYPDEADYVMGIPEATIVRIKGRDNGGSRAHQSEAQVDSIKPHYTIHNTGDYMFLAYQLEHLCRDLNIFKCHYEWKTS